MKKEISELVFILDKSSSMHGLELETIAGFNNMLEKQKELKDECYITTVLFNHTYELLHDRANIKAVNSLNENDYYVDGCTALIDAMGKTIKKITKAQKHISLEYCAKKIIFVIITDGLENASHHYSLKEVKKMIEAKKELGWEFIFLGANIDAVETAKEYGINSDRAQNFHADEVGIELNFKAINNALKSYRTDSLIVDNWDIEIESDYKARNNKK